MFLRSCAGWDRPLQSVVAFARSLPALGLFSGGFEQAFAAGTAPSLLAPFEVAPLWCLIAWPHAPGFFALALSETLGIRAQTASRAFQGG